MISVRLVTVEPPCEGPSVDFLTPEIGNSVKFCTMLPNADEEKKLIELTENRFVHPKSPLAIDVDSALISVIESPGSDSQDYSYRIA